MELRRTTPIETPGIFDLSNTSSTKLETAGVITLGRDDGRGGLGTRKVAWALDESGVVAVAITAPTAKEVSRPAAIDTLIMC